MKYILQKLLLVHRNAITFCILTMNTITWLNSFILVILFRLFMTMYTICCLWTKMLFSSFFNLCAFYLFTSYFFFYTFYLLLEVGRPKQCQVEMVRVDISALFLILWGDVSDFTRKYESSCMFFIDFLYQTKKVSFHLQSTERLFGF